MKVQNDTLWLVFSPCIPYLQPGEMDKIIEAAPHAVIGAGGYYDLTIAQLAAIVNHNDTTCIVNKADEELTVYEYCTIKGLKEWFEKFVKQIKTLTIPATDQEQRASRACLEVSFVESLLLFARQYFGLHSFREAEQVTLGDVILAKKDAYNKEVFQKAYSEIMYKKK